MTRNDVLICTIAGLALGAYIGLAIGEYNADAAEIVIEDASVLESIE